MAGFELHIVTPEKTVYAGTVDSLQAPGSEGSFGVLVNHTPMLAQLTIGRVKFTEVNGDTRFVAVGGGFAEVGGDHVTILAETAEMAEDIDLERAQAARDRAQERINQGRRSDVDFMRAQAALARSLNRIEISGLG